METLKHRQATGASSDGTRSQRGLHYEYSRGTDNGSDNGNRDLPAGSANDDAISGAKSRNRHPQKRPRKRSSLLRSVWLVTLLLCATWLILLSRWTTSETIQGRDRHHRNNFGLIPATELYQTETAVRDRSFNQPRQFFQPLQRSVKPDRRYRPTLTQPKQQGGSHVNAYTPLQRPRVVGMYFNAPTVSNVTSVITGAEPIDPNLIRRPAVFRRISFHGFPDTKEARKAQKALADSDDYWWSMQDAVETEDCELQHEWQKHSIPTCNMVMEQDLTQVMVDDDDSHNWPIRYLANGYWRDVWRVQADARDLDDYHGRSVLKVMRYEHDYTDRNYDRHRRDALAMERLTKSEHIMDIYAFCGNSGLFEFANGGSLYDAIFQYRKDEYDNWSTRDRLKYARQATLGLVAMHNIDQEGVPSMAHTDITTAQFVWVQQRRIYKLNDFNRARFITINRETGKTCPFRIGNNPGRFRAPEEYIEPHKETEKIDVYSLGNVLYCILTGLWPFDIEGMSSNDVAKSVSKGGRPKIPEQYTNTTDPFTRILLDAMKMAWRQDVEKRASALEMLQFMEREVLAVAETQKTAGNEGSKPDGGTEHTRT